MVKKCALYFGCRKDYSDQDCSTCQRLAHHCSSFPPLGNSFCLEILKGRNGPLCLATLCRPWTPPPNEESFFKLSQCIWKQACIQTALEESKHESHVLDLTKCEKRPQNYDFWTHQKHNCNSFCTCIYLRFSNFSLDSSFSLSSWDKDHVLSRILISHVCSRYKRHECDQCIRVFSSPGLRSTKIGFVKAFKFSFFFLKMGKWIWKFQFVKFSFFSNRNKKIFIFIFTKKWKMNFERQVPKVVFNFQQKWKWTKIFIFHFQILRKMNWHSTTCILD